MVSFAGRWRGLTNGVVAAVRRFPLPLAASVTGAITGCLCLGEHLYGPDGDGPLRVIMTSWLGIPLFLGAALVGARRTAGLALSAAAAVLVAACFAGLGGHEQWTFIRFALFLLAAHALLALAPLARAAPRGDFAPFNLMLFARTALALLLTHVLYAGLCFALAALEHLFDLRIPGQLYGQLWFALMGVFNTAYVLTGIPQDWDQLDGRFETPRPLDVLARLVLLPLSILYLGILYVYSVKILVVHEWPRGWVSAPIIVFAAIGLLTVLLLEPGRLTGSRLVRAYCRGFFVALLPLVVLLFLAISRREVEYGLTEERCLVYAIAVFLALIAPYFVLSRARNLAAIPLLLAAIAVMTAIGPLSARSLALRSQTARLRGLLEENHRLANGVLVRNNHHASRKDEHEIGATLEYLETRHALGPVLAWRPAKAACSACAPLAAATTGRELVAALGLNYRPGRYSDGVETMTSISAPTPEVLETDGFSIIFPSLICYGNHEGCQTNESKPAHGWRAAVEGLALVVTGPHHERIQIPLAGLERDAKETTDEDGTLRRLLVRDGRGTTLRYRLYVGSVLFDHGEDDGPAKVANFTGILMLGPAEPP